MLTWIQDQKEEKKSYCQGVLTYRKLELTLGSTPSNQFILAGVFYRETLDSGSILQILQAIQRGNSPIVDDDATTETGLSFAPFKNKIKDLLPSESPKKATHILCSPVSLLLDKMMATKAVDQVQDRLMIKILFAQFLHILTVQEQWDNVQDPFTPRPGVHCAHSLDHSSMECCVKSFNCIDETNRYIVVEGI